MRRTVSVLLFVLGGWILTSGTMMGWFDLGEGPGTQLGMFGIFCAFSAPFLLLAMWASTGRRLRELGLTLWISAAVGVSLGLMLLLVLNDPSFTRLLPPQQTMPDLKFAPSAGLLGVLLVGGVGWLLYRLPART